MENGFQISSCLKQRKAYMQSLESEWIQADQRKTFSQPCDLDGVIITGRYLRSINRYQIKETAKLTKMMSLCKKYTRRWFGYRRAKRRILDKTNNQIRDCNHKFRQTS